MNSIPLYQIFLALHLLGLALGLGGVAITDYSFFRIIHTSDQVKPESIDWLKSFSAVIWVGIGILCLSGVGLFLIHPKLYLSIPGFIAKMVFVAILIINGLFLNFYTTAKLTTFNFSEKYQHHGATWRARKLSFIFGAISTTTWYATFLTAMFKLYLHWSLIQYMIVYAAVISVAIAGALLGEWLMSKRQLPVRNTIDKLAYSMHQIPQAPVSPPPASQPVQQSAVQPTPPNVKEPAQPSNQPSNPLVH